MTGHESPTIGVSGPPVQLAYRPGGRPDRPPSELEALAFELPAPAPRPNQSSWRAGLPTLTGSRLTLRELRVADAPALFEQLTTEEVTRFISPPPTSVAGFEQFIAWAHQRRTEGRYACFAVIPHGHNRPVGLFQLHVCDEATGLAEWGFVLAAPFWGRGLFLDGALLLLPFAFATVGVRRLEARACLANARGVGALRKVGARFQRVLPKAFVRDGRAFDQGLWYLTPLDWQRFGTPRTHAVH